MSETPPDRIGICTNIGKLLKVVTIFPMVDMSTVVSSTNDVRTETRTKTT